MQVSRPAVPATDPISSIAVTDLIKSTFEVSVSACRLYARWTRPDRVCRSRSQISKPIPTPRCSARRRSRN